MYTIQAMIWIAAIFNAIQNTIQIMIGQIFMTLLPDKSINQIPVVLPFKNNSQ